MLISSVLLVQADEGVSFLVVDRIGDIYRDLPRRADVIVTTVGARHKCQQDRKFEIFETTAGRRRVRRRPIACTLAVSFACWPIERRRLARVVALRCPHAVAILWPAVATMAAGCGRRLARAVAHRCPPALCHGHCWSKIAWALWRAVADAMMLAAAHVGR
ncbi:hypothetical protein F511_45557 [Dorcoceras hygrometricum]|uniref:Uncharacterized protein n=1 Tax=Dorcoceras hygrometricum TaxID=472368 RepID=A0A2Z7A3D8_9LAMI|nr:hypothetical protein F511_45557 [Dorcoceras hygrometricum]